MNFHIKSVGTTYDITSEQIVQAMDAFDHGNYPTYYHNWLTNPNFTRAVEYDGHLYPPKCLIHHVTGIPSSDFHTDEAEEILTQLQFSVIDKPTLP